MNYQTIRVHYEESVCFLKLLGPDEKSTITDCMIRECEQVLAACSDSIRVVVLEGLPAVFCLGADFSAIDMTAEGRRGDVFSPEKLYDLWLRLSQGPYATIAHVRGKTTAGGIGFIAACDVVLSDQTAEFSLSELLFDLLPACVLPFLIRKIGYQRAHYMSLTSQPISAAQAHQWGLVDAFESDSQALLRRHLLRLGRISKKGIRQYKQYLRAITDSLSAVKTAAVDMNREVFSDPDALRKIHRYVHIGQFPWEK